jgi:hypothetical protein
MIDTILSRRHSLTGASATAAASLVGSASPVAPRAPLLKTQAPAFYRFNVGNIEATVLSDGLIVGVPKSTSSAQRRPSASRFALLRSAEMILAPPAYRATF